MSGIYKSILLEQVQINLPLPCNIHIFLDSRYIVFRGKGDTINQQTYDRLQFKNIKNLHVLENNFPAIEDWIKKSPPLPSIPTQTKENRQFIAAWKDLHRKTLDIFQSNHPEDEVKLVIRTSKRLVSEMVKLPYSVKALNELQTFSRGTVDHSVNVSVLSVYLAMQMGYSHNLILQHVALGGILHDIGKPKVDILEADTDPVIEEKLKQHPALGLEILEKSEGVPDEVKLIVAQHHELHDGTGYPKKLRGTGIYDLARIVCTANVFDHLVADGEGTLPERQKKALGLLDQKYYNKIDHDKHEKAIRILDLGI